MSERPHESSDDAAAGQRWMLHPSGSVFTVRLVTEEHVFLSDADGHDAGRLRKSTLTGKCTRVEGSSA